MKEKKEKRKVYKKVCPYCNKEFISLSKKQVEYNYYTHLGACKKRVIKKATE